MRNIVIFSGGFQPFGPHHFEAYKHLCNIFEKRNVFVATSDYVTEQRPLNFSQKRLFCNKYGIEPIKVKSPYSCEEILQHFNPDTTTITFAVSDKDSGRLHSQKFTKYENLSELKSFSTNKYIYEFPKISLFDGDNEISGTYLRKVIGQADKKRFEKIMGWYDKSLHDLCKQIFTKTTILNNLSDYMSEILKSFNIQYDINESDINTFEKFQKHCKKISILWGIYLCKNNDTANSIINSLNSNNLIPHGLRHNIDDMEIVPFVKLNNISESYKNSSKTNHIYHIYESGEITGKELKKIIEDIINGNIEIIEKLDGQNLKVTVKNGSVLSARNKTTIKNPMSPDELKYKYTGRGSLQDSFYDAHINLQNAILDSDVAMKILNGGFRFLNVEILNPLTKNISDYDKKMLCLHDVIEYDVNGNEVNRNREAAVQIFNSLNYKKSIKHNSYNIIKPNTLKIQCHQNNIQNIKILLSNIKDTDMITGKHEIFIAKISNILLNCVQNNIGNINVTMSDIIEHGHDLTFQQQLSYAENFTKLSKIENINNFEGFVFTFKNKLYKMTGTFRYINQILGLKRYNK